MNRVLISLLTLTVIFTVSAPMTFAQDKAKKAKKKKKNFQVTITQSNKPKTVLSKASARAGSSLFSSGSGKAEIEVKKDGGKLKIKVPFDKIAKIKILKVHRDYVSIELTTHKKSVLKGHVVTNLEFLGETEFGEGSIRVRDAAEIVIKEIK
jgi:hypothetical protein